MTKLPVLALAGIAAAAIAGTAIAANSKDPCDERASCPTASVAHVQYVGDVAPKVTVEPRRFAGIGRRVAATGPAAASPASTR